jgi:hypothetical protein
VIVTLPFAVPVAKPPAVIAAIEVLELLQTTDDVMSFPKLSMASNCNWEPGAIVGLAGVTVIDVTVLPPVDRPPVGWTPVPERLIVAGDFVA